MQATYHFRCVSSLRNITENGLPVWLFFIDRVCRPVSLLRCSEGQTWTDWYERKKPKKGDGNVYSRIWARWQGRRLKRRVSKRQDKSLGVNIIDVNRNEFFGKSVS